jgi:hypothetical protein
MPYRTRLHEFCSKNLILCNTILKTIFKGLGLGSKNLPPSHSSHPYTMAQILKHQTFYCCYSTFCTLWECTLGDSHGSAVAGIPKHSLATNENAN